MVRNLRDLFFKHFNKFTQPSSLSPSRKYICQPQAVHLTKACGCNWLSARCEVSEERRRLHAELGFDDGHGIRCGERRNSVAEVAQLAEKR